MGECSQGRAPYRDEHRAGALPVCADLDGFDFATQPLDKKQIHEIACGRFIANLDASAAEDQANSYSLSGYSGGNPKNHRVADRDNTQRTRLNAIVSKD